MMTPEEHQQEAMLLHDLKHENPKLRKRIEKLEALIDRAIAAIDRLSEHKDQYGIDSEVPDQGWILDSVNRVFLLADDMRKERGVE